MKKKKKEFKIKILQRFKEVLLILTIFVLVVKSLRALELKKLLRSKIIKVLKLIFRLKMLNLEFNSFLIYQLIDLSI